MGLSIWHNGVIWLDYESRTNAVAAQDGVIIAVGQSALDLINTEQNLKSTQFVHDLTGGTLLAGFGDGHAHPINGGIETLFAPVGKAKSIDEVVEIVKQFAKANPNLEIIRGEGYDPSLAPKGEFQATWLDAAVSDRPVVLRALDYHTAWLNTAALNWAGINSNTAEPHLGEIPRDGEGHPIGTLREWGAWDLAYKKLPKLSTEQKLAAITYATNYYAAVGVTWLQDAWVDQETYEIWLLGAENKILKQRVNFAWLASPLSDWRSEISEWKERKKYLAENFAGQLTGNSVKIFVDGILEGGTASLLENYCDCPTTGIPNWTKPELTEVIEEVIKNGFQPHIHAIGDAGIRDALDALEFAKEKFGSTNNAVIAHSQLIAQSDRPRFKEIGVIANFEPLWAQLSDEQLQLTIPRIGEARAKLQYPIASMLKLGTDISFGSDWPVTSGAPIEGIMTAVTRQTETGYPLEGWLPEEKITLNQAVYAYTYGVALQAGEINNWGTIKPGLRADLVAFDCDLTKLADSELGSARVVGTWLGGIRVFG